jgi:hypothetical protein
MYINEMGWRRFCLLHYIDKEAESTTEVSVKFEYWEHIAQIKATVESKKFLQSFFFSLEDTPFTFEAVLNGDTSSILFNPLLTGIRGKLKLLIGDVEENQFVGEEYDLED